MNPEILAIQQWIDAVLDAVQEIIASGETIPDEVYGMVADAIQAAQSEIEALQEPQISAAPEIPQGPYPSSNINGFKFDPKTGNLFVQFHGPYPQAAGSIYVYKNVPDYIYDIFSRGAIGPRTSGQNRYHRWIRGVTPSLGGSLNALLKRGGFAYQRLS